jgi:hypothetical protein
MLKDPRYRDQEQQPASDVRLQQYEALFALELAPIMAELAELSANQAAAELNRRKIASSSDGKWHPATVISLRERLVKMMAGAVPS